MKFFKDLFKLFKNEDDYNPLLDDRLPEETKQKLKEMREEYVDTFKGLFVRNFKTYRSAFTDMNTIEDIRGIEDMFSDLFVKLGSNGFLKDDTSEEAAENIDSILKWLPTYFVYLKANAIMKAVEQNIPESHKFGKDFIKFITQNCKTRRKKDNE